MRLQYFSNVRIVVVVAVFVVHIVLLENEFVSLFSHLRCILLFGLVLSLHISALFKSILLFKGKDLKLFQFQIESRKIEFFSFFALIKKKMEKNIILFKFIYIAVKVFLPFRKIYLI